MLTFLPMIFNPIIYIALTIISLLLGTVALNETDSWLVMIPALVFVVLLFASLLQPVKRIPAIHNQAEFKTPNLM